MKFVTPAPENWGKELENNFGELAHSSKKHHKIKGINHIRILNEIAAKWVRMGCYNEPGRALRALIGGEL